jgi:hypothetical protein
MHTKKRSLQVHENLVFERRLWRVQRIGWIVIAALLLLALAGLFGNGPLSHAVASAGTLQVSYERFAHADAPATLRIDVRQPSEGTVRVAINREYLDTLRVEHILPEPLRTVSGGEEHTFEFASPGNADLHISIEASPQAPGMPVARVRLLQEPNAILRFRQVVYP